MPRWADIEAMAAQGPGQQVAFVPERASSLQIAEHLAALANADGGMLIVTRSGRPNLRPGLVDPPAALQRAVEAVLLCEPRLVMPLPQVMAEGKSLPSSQSVTSLTMYTPKTGGVLRSDFPSTRTR